jgi:hypothetical protein
MTKTPCHVLRPKGKAVATTFSETTAIVAVEMKAELLAALLELRQKIRLRAYEISLACDGVSCAADDNWIKAEQEVKATSKHEMSC